MPRAVLLTGVGKRYDIVSAFARHTTVVAADPNPLAPAQYAATVRTSVPRIADPELRAGAPGLCERHDVGAIVPLTDLDIETLAVARADGRLPQALVPDPEIATATYDKYEAHLLLGRLGLPSPPTVLPGDEVESLPRHGQAAARLRRRVDPPSPTTPPRRAFFCDYVDGDVMVQRRMDGPEFSIDTLSDRDGRCLNAIPRSMIESRGGESIKGTVLDDPELVELGRTVVEAIGTRGPCTVQVFRDREIGLGITDVNTRFGGAFPAPMYAARPGRTYPELIARMAAGETIEPHVGDYRSGSHVHALLLAARARRGAAADGARHRRPAGTAGAEVTTRPFVDYERHGRTYAQHRRPDPRIAARDPRGARRRRDGDQRRRRRRLLRAGRPLGGGRRAERDDARPAPARRRTGDRRPRRGAAVRRRRRRCGDGVRDDPPLAPAGRRSARAAPRRARAGRRVHVRARRPAGSGSASTCASWSRSNGRASRRSPTSASGARWTHPCRGDPDAGRLHRRLLRGLLAPARGAARPAGARRAVGVGAGRRRDAGADRGAPGGGACVRRVGRSATGTCASSTSSTARCAWSSASRARDRSAAGPGPRGPCPRTRCGSRAARPTSCR